MPVQFVTAEKEYSKNKELKPEDIKALKEWMEKQVHLPSISEEQLILFYQSCYFRSEAAKSAIENYFTVRTHTPEVFQNISLKNLEPTMDMFLATPLPEKTPEGYHILFARLLDFNPDKYNATNSMTYFDMVCSLTLAQHGTSNGHILVTDATGCSLGHLLKLNAMLAKKYIFYLQDGLPVRVKGIHVINTLPFVDRLLQMFKHVIKQGIIDLVHLHSKMDEFYKYIPQKLMPNEYGGEAGSFLELRDKMIKNVKENESFFLEHSKLLVDETKRVGKSKFLSDMTGLGVEGTFKKLNID